MSGDEKDSYVWFGRAGDVRIVAPSSLGVSSGFAVNFAATPAGVSFIVPGSPQLSSAAAEFIAVLSETSSSAFPGTTSATKIKEVRQALFVARSRLPTRIRERISANLDALLDAIDEEQQEEPGDAVSLSLVSFGKALQFLESARPAFAPTFAITDGGDFYLEWLDQATNVVGITFRQAGDAVWSATQLDQETGRRMNEAGTRPDNRLAELLLGVAPWLLDPEHDASARNRAAA